MGTGSENIAAVSNRTLDYSKTEFKKALLAMFDLIFGTFRNAIKTSSTARGSEEDFLILSQSSNHIMIIIHELTTKPLWLTAPQENRNALKKKHVFLNVHGIWRLVFAKIFCKVNMKAGEPHFITHPGLELRGLEDSIVYSQHVPDSFLPPLPKKLRLNCRQCIKSYEIFV